MPLSPDVPVSTRLKLSAAWASTMFCYLYCDYFELYVPGKLSDMLQGDMGPLGQVTQAVLLGTGTLMLVPSLLVFLSVALSRNAVRWLNVFFRLFYSAIMGLLLVMAGWWFYTLFAAVEMILTVYIAWTAWRWSEDR
jgi:hypothetical protein